MEEWRPHPKQEFALLRDEFEILYGGQRGGGKSDAGIVWLLGDEYEDGKLYVQHPQYRALVLRKNSNDLSDWLDRAGFMYKRYGAEIVGNPPIVRWPSGAVFRTGHLKNKDSYEKFLGHEYQRMVIEELTQIPKELYYIEILGSCRSSLPELRPQVFCTSNPGGIGHNWVRQRFVSVAAPNEPYTYSEVINGKNIERSRIYIPASIDDNPTLVNNDPGYVLYLETIKDVDPDLYEAWRHGNWDVFAGQFFKKFNRSTHVLPLDSFKGKLTKMPQIAGVDWGYSNPFVYLQSAVFKVTLYTKKGDPITFNRVVTYKEIGGTEKNPEEWGREIAKMDLSDMVYIRCDPSMFNKGTDGSVAIADKLKSKLGVDAHLIKPASNNRVNGWAVMQDWLSLAPDGLPYWMITDNCIDLIDTLPTLPRDDNNVEDIDTDSDDHWCDAARYMLKHVKFIDAYVGLGRDTINVKETYPTYSPGIHSDWFIPDPNETNTWQNQ